jgi:hypothetical protein
MGRKRVLALTVAVIAAVVIIGGVVLLAAQVPPPPIATEFLSGRAVFTDDIDLKMKIRREGEPPDVVNAEDPRAPWSRGSRSSPEPRSLGTRMRAPWWSTSFQGRSSMFRPMTVRGFRTRLGARGLGPDGTPPLASDRRTEQDSMTRKPSRPPEGS